MSVVSASQKHLMLSFRLQNLKVQNNYRASLGETFEQEYIFLNDGQLDWPEDTFLIFSGVQNSFNLEEEIVIGHVPKGESISIQMLITVPTDFEAERFSVEYEFRHQM